MGFKKFIKRLFKTEERPRRCNDGHDHHYKDEFEGCNGILNKKMDLDLAKEDHRHKEVMADKHIQMGHMAIQYQKGNNALPYGGKSCGSLPALEYY